MEMNILEDLKTKIVFELVGEDDTFCNVLKEELWNDSDVDAAAYNVKHPLVSSPVFIVETKKGDPRKALKGAVDRLKKTNKEFLTAFKKVVK